MIVSNSDISRRSCPTTLKSLFKCQDDYLVGVSNGLDLSCTVGEDGRYDADLHPELSGFDVLGEGSEKVRLQL